MALVEVRDVCVRFGGITAVSDACIDINAGEVTGLIGPNGAGKTTLFNVVSGLQVPASGRVAIDGTDVTREKPHRRARLGIARTFQRLEIFGTMSVEENVLIAAETARGWQQHSTPTHQIVGDILEKIGLSEIASTRADELPTGTGRLVELARAMASQPRVLLLDEPSSGLDKQETAEFGQALRTLSADGVGILLVEHDTAFVMDICKYINVLHFGKVIASGTPAEVQQDQAVREAYLGVESEIPARQTVTLPRQDRKEGAPAKGRAASNGKHVAAVAAVALAPDGPADEITLTPPALELLDIHAGYSGIDVLHGVDLRLAKGEVFALLGPNGAGKSTTLKVACGQIAPSRGEVRFSGRSVAGIAADVLARAGVCTIPEGRGIFPNLTVAENLWIMTFNGAKRADIEERAFAQFPKLAERRRQLAGTMSGGEQQMLAMARALTSDPSVLILDELSLGLAPLVVRELYEIVGGIAAQGVSVLIVEQFAHEIVHVADEAAVLLHGHIEMRGKPHVVAEALTDAYLSSATPARR